tara:strand:+ start:38 stop:811 length:774 start_codon:yes stop_codon:yes gene_type:complete
MIIDSHCHLDFPELYNNLSEILERASVSKIDHMLTICTTLNSFEKIKLIINKYKNIYGTIGIHPHETKNYSNINSTQICDLKKQSKKIIGIGETGLDFYYNNSDKNLQKKIFIAHIESAIKLDLPIIVHSRNAETETLDILKSEAKNSNLKTLVHCFTGTKEFAKNLLNIDAYISISGIVTFKNSTDLANTVSFIPNNKLLVETDSPYLSPIPLRGKVNEPSHIIHTIKKIADIKNVSEKTIIKSTTENFKKLFDII